MSLSRDVSTFLIFGLFVQIIIYLPPLNTRPGQGLCKNNSHHILIKFDLHLESIYHTLTIDLFSHKAVGTSLVRTIVCFTPISTAASLVHVDVTNERVTVFDHNGGDLAIRKSSLKSFWVIGTLVSKEQAYEVARTLATTAAVSIGKEGTSTSFALCFVPEIGCKRYHFLAHGSENPRNQNLCIGSDASYFQVV